MHKGIFITGTDTDVGKTIVAAGLLHLLRSKGVDAVPMKPVQTGCTLENGVFKAPDLDFSILYSGLQYTDEEYQCMSPYKYKPACSPHLAGNLSGDLVDMKQILLYLEKLKTLREFVIVEGAGGIMVPLNNSDMMLDLMKAVGFPVVLVARTGLGTINHTLLSLQVLRNTGLKVLGVIFNNTVAPTPETKFICDDNVNTIAKCSGVNVLGNISHLGDFNESNFNVMKECFDRSIDYDTLLNM